MISARLEIAIVEAIHQHAAIHRQHPVDLPQALLALRRVSSDLLATITDFDERARIDARVDELQRAVPWQTPERDQGQLRAEDVRHSPSMADTAEGGGRCGAAAPIGGGKEGRS